MEKKRQKISLQDNFSIENHENHQNCYYRSQNKLIRDLNNR